ncbi:uncharacterized protein [Euwallacea similis]|uniref:uncharacterized protein n=1 Tax=Euwallacea similis TaxID=1736056 RepID=UPI00344D789D
MTGRLEAVSIRGIDACATRQEVIQVLAEVIPGWTGVNYVSELRPMLNSMQAITLIAEKWVIKALEKERTIRIGMVRCHVERRIELPRCFRCWEYGLAGRKCKGTDRSGLCYRCGGEGVVDMPATESIGLE